jgi:hypothetical protein
MIAFPSSTGAFDTSGNIGVYPIFDAFLLSLVVLKKC